jgi:hypothetical protein
MVSSGFVMLIVSLLGDVHLALSARFPWVVLLGLSDRTPVILTPKVAHGV